MGGQPHAVPRPLHHVEQLADRQYVTTASNLFDRGTVYFRQKDGALVLECQYSTALFDAGTVRRWLQGYENLLAVDQYPMFGGRLDRYDWKLVGKRLARLDTVDKVTGRQVYGADLQLPGMLNAAVKDCPVFGGKVKSFDAAAVANRPGAVHDMLVPLKSHGVSMTRFESRPARSGQWEYYFYIDLQGHPDEPHVEAAMHALRAACAFFKVLGTYPIDVH